MLRKGIMGGTFDPIHNGHLALAEYAYRQYDLEKVLFLPAGNPPHKQNRRDGASDAQRLAMVALALRDYPYFSLDSEEMERVGLTYTKDTLVRLKNEEPDTDFYFLIGADSLMAFDTWYHPEIICDNCILIVAGRGGLDEEVLLSKMDQLQKDYNASVSLLDFPEMDISSTNLRKQIREHHSVRGYIPDAVVDYIAENDIYGE
ncbi:MAG: nicotinate-nucleotide adenylyltransferase [Lachnospiraceae bacterium]|nr:nicotinate-nucleotide adenylyltransferase [Lachnospiraceae bacterium]